MRPIDADELVSDQIYTSEYGWQKVYWAHDVDNAPTLGNIQVQMVEGDGMADFILHWLADVYGNPCEYDFAGIETNAYLDQHDPEYCAEHCGQNEYECWKRFLELKYQETRGKM